MKMKKKEPMEIVVAVNFMLDIKLNKSSLVQMNFVFFVLKEFIFNFSFCDPYACVLAVEV